ncbi:MAG: GNAT family N-acetyltransferase [Ruminococcus sp.]|nr:GNAT family N-acetyltransferase [Ruminococcus sp.]
MLLIFENMTPDEADRLMEVYQGSNLENVGYFYPDCKDKREGFNQVVNRFKSFLLDEFFQNEQNSYYVWEKDGIWRSAFRLTKLDSCYFMEALETRPDSRRMGYSEKLFKAVFDKLSESGNFIIRSHVSKKNTASLAAHMKVGFEIEFQDAVQFLNPNEPTNPRSYGMIYRSK